MNIAENITPEDFKDLAKGAIYGALCGDSFGSYCEFQNTVSQDEVNEAVEMNGGGPFELGPGQVTDDGELALCLGHGLVEGNGALDLNSISKYYKKWLGSSPFDIGYTTRTAFYGMMHNDGENLAKVCRRGSSQSPDSQSNGGLMRITPIGVWCSELSKEDLIRCVREETRLTHPNQTAIDTSIIYVYTIQHLLKNKGDNLGAYEKAKEMAKDLNNPEINQWMQELEANVLPPANQKIGWVKIALLYSLYFLKNKTPYYEAQKEMIAQGGDTDTNCCIIGGVLGALFGYKALPEKFIGAVTTFDPKTKGGIKRPDFLLVAKCGDMIDKLIEIRPKGAVKIVAEETEEEKANFLKSWH